MMVTIIGAVLVLNFITGFMRSCNGHTGSCTCVNTLKLNVLTPQRTPATMSRNNIPAMMGTMITHGSVLSDSRSGVGAVSATSGGIIGMITWYGIGITE